jgi:hypothetical protein
VLLQLAAAAAAGDDGDARVLAIELLIRLIVDRGLYKHSSRGPGMDSPAAAVEWIHGYSLLYWSKHRLKEAPPPVFFAHPPQGITATAPGGCGGLVRGSGGPGM